jgi:hypothetical protein
MSNPVDQIDYLIDEYEEIEWINNDEMEHKDPYDDFYL